MSVGAVSNVDYRALMDRVVRFMEGKTEGVLKELRRDMEQAADRMEFEQAAALRDRLRSAERVVDQQAVTTSHTVDFDAIGLAKTTEQMLAATRPGVNGLRDGGTAVLVGVPHGPAPTINVRDMFTGKIFRGAPGGSCRPDRDLPMFVRWFKEGRLPLDALVTRRYRLEQINEACDDLAHGKIAGRAIVEL